MPHKAQKELDKAVKQTRSAADITFSAISALQRCMDEATVFDQGKLHTPQAQLQQFELNLKTIADQLAAYKLQGE